MSVTTSNLIQGPATLYVAVFGAAEPLATAVSAVPASAVWTDLGATDGGVKVVIGNKTAQLNVDQVTFDVESRKVTESISVQTQLAEPTLANLVYALNSGVASTAVGVNTFTPAVNVATPTYVALMVDGVAPLGFRRRIIIRKAINTANVESSYKKDGQAYWTSTFLGHYVSAAITPYIIFDQTA